MKAPRSWPKSSRLDERRAARAAQSKTTNGSPRARARVVERLGEHLLAGAGLALEQHAEIASGDSFERGEQRVHGGRGGDGMAEARDRVDARVRVARRQEELGLADAHRRFLREGDAADAGRAVEAAVFRVEIGDAQAALDGGDVEVEARDPRISEHEIGVRIATDDEAAAVELGVGAGIGASDDANAVERRDGHVGTMPATARGRD